MHNFKIWLNKWLHKITHSDIDLMAIKQKMHDGTATSDDLLSYVDSLELQINSMVQMLKELYRRNSITFSGFKSYTSACAYLRASIIEGSESDYNNLIKLEPMITSEQNRHSTLIKLAVLPSGKRVIEEIYKNPADKKTFETVFGVKNSDKLEDEGMYQKIWQEVHNLSEYILIHKNKVYH